LPESAGEAAGILRPSPTLQVPLVYTSITSSSTSARRPARSRRGTSRSAGRKASELLVHLLPSDEIERALKRFGGAPGFAGDNGDCRVVRDGAGHDAILLGLGKRESITALTIRTAGAKVVKLLDRTGASQARITFEGSTFAKDADLYDLGMSFGEGAAVGNWQFASFAGSATNKKKAGGPLAIGSTDADFGAGINAGLALAESVNFSRDLSATPPNICTPDWIARQAQKLARSHGMRCRVISYTEAKRLGMGGLVAVGMGSAAKPCIIVLEWSPKRAARKHHLCLVGKTLTYDTGGYSLKVNNGMKGMKYDKCGGTAVLGAMRAIATAKLPVRVTALLPAAENMVSNDSFRPDDIITLHNGVTVEVTNTDAEGRLVLADALSWACTQVKPTHIVDMATLTGGVVVALGSWCAGLMCNDTDLRGRVERSGSSTGDRVWHLPLWPEHREHMRSQHADIINSNPSRLGHPLQGGAFLSYFVDESIPWAHVDIAGVANVDSATDVYTTPGPTGFGVKLLYDIARGFGG
jgi:leucyl aminopeptidase